MAPKLKFALVCCLFAAYAVELVVPNTVNSINPPEPTTAGPVNPPNPTTAGPVNPPNPTTAGPVNPTNPATAGPVNPPNPTTAGPVNPPNPTTAGPVNPPNPTTAGPVNPPNPTTAGPVNPPNPTTAGPVNPPNPTTAGPVNPPNPTTAGPVNPPNPTTEGPVNPPNPTTAGPVSPPNPTTAGPVNPTNPPNPTTDGPVNPPNPTTAGPINSTNTPNPTTPTHENSTNSTDSVSPSTGPAPTELPDICDLQPCPDRSECEPRANNTRVCICRAGEYFNEGSQLCETAKVFPGQLQVPGLAFEEEMKNKTSLAFQRAAKQITDQIDLAFNANSGYSSSIVLELKQIGSLKVQARPGLSASVEMVFQTSAQVTTQDVVKVLVNAAECGACPLANSTFTNSSLCIKQPCDEKTTTCSAGDRGDFVCSCLKDYIMTDYSQRACVACPSGQIPNGDRECKNCPFGYSGFNCSEPWKLVLVIVGSVLGGLLLITVIVLIVMSTKSPKKSSKTKKNKSKTGNPDMIQFSDKDPLVTSLPTNHQEPLAVTEPTKGVRPFPNGGVPRIPRATAANAWDSGSNLEMTPTTSRHSSVAQGKSSWLNDTAEDINDSPYSRPRNQTNPYAQSRPMSNPYSESRSLNNPYTQDRPQTNPYARNNPSYSHDNERPFNY